MFTEDMNIEDMYIEKLKREIRDGEILKLSFPLEDDVIDYIKWKLMNLNLVKTYIDDHTKDTFQLPYKMKISEIAGLPQTYKIKKIPNLDYKGKSFYTPFLFSDEFRQKMLSCPKTLLFRSEITPSNWTISNGYTNCLQYNDITNYYIGNVNSHYILFKEDIFVPSDQCKYDVGGYSFSAIIGGEKKGLMPLIRYDHNPSYAHQNIFKNGKISNNADTIYGSHIHFADYLTNLIAFERIHSPNAEKIDTEGLDFTTMINIIQNCLANDNAPMYNQYRKKLDPNTQIVVDYKKRARTYSKLKNNYNYTTSFVQNVKKVTNKIQRQMMLGFSCFNCSKRTLKTYSIYKRNIINQKRTSYENAKTFDEINEQNK